MVMQIASLNYAGLIIICLHRTAEQHTEQWLRARCMYTHARRYGSNDGEAGRARAVGHQDGGRSKRMYAVARRQTQAGIHLDTKLS